MDDLPIRVLLVDDSPLVLAALQRLLQAEAPRVQVVGTAHDGHQALELIARLDPQVVCTDLHMPGMGGLELTRQVMERFPRPVLVVSDYVHAEDESNVFHLLQAGAVDVFPKPREGLNSPALGRELAQKIRVLAGVFVFKRPRRTDPEMPATAQASPEQPFQVVAVGASTGGPRALRSVLGGLPADFPVPVLCVQHISSGFLKGMVEWLDAQCPLRVCIARDGERARPGHVYFAPDDRHLLFEQYARLQLSGAEPMDGHRPSVSATFAAVARTCGSAAVGVLLTGMGEDGAAGLEAMAGAGAMTVAQDEASSLVFGMPAAAIARGAARRVLPLEQIAAALVETVSGRS